MMTFPFDVRYTRLYVSIVPPYYNRQYCCYWEMDLHLEHYIPIAVLQGCDVTVVLQDGCCLHASQQSQIQGVMSDTYMYIYMALAECYEYINLALWWWVMYGHYDCTTTLRMVLSFVYELYEMIIHVKCIEIYATHLYWILADYFQMICIWLFHCMWLILRCFKYHMNIMLVIIDWYLMTCYILHRFYENSFNAWIFVLSNVSHENIYIYMIYIVYCHYHQHLYFYPSRQSSSLVA